MCTLCVRTVYTLYTLYTRYTLYTLYTHQQVHVGRRNFFQGNAGLVTLDSYATWYASTIFLYSVYRVYRMYSVYTVCTQCVHMPNVYNFGADIVRQYRMNARCMRHPSSGARPRVGDSRSGSFYGVKFARFVRTFSIFRRYRIVSVHPGIVNPYGSCSHIQ